CGRDARRRRKMAIRLAAADRPRRRLAHLEQRSAMARLVVNRVIAGGTVWPRVGLLSLPRIFSAGAVDSCARNCIPRRGGVVGIFTQEPLTSNPHIVCRSCFYRSISASQRQENFVRC